MKLKKILKVLAYVVFTVILYLGGVVLAVNIYVHNTKQYVPTVTAAQKYIQDSYSPSPTPSLTYTPTFYPTTYFPSPNPTMGIPPGPTPCTTKKCD